MLQLMPWHHPSHPLHSAYAAVVGTTFVHVGLVVVVVTLVQPCLVGPWLAHDRVEQNRPAAPQASENDLRYLTTQ